MLVLAHKFCHFSPEITPSSKYYSLHFRGEHWGSGKLICPSCPSCQSWTSEPRPLDTKTSILSTAPRLIPVSKTTGSLFCIKSPAAGSQRMSKSCQESPRTQCISHIARFTWNKTSLCLLGPCSLCVGWRSLMKHANFLNNISVEWELMKGLRGMKITGQITIKHPIVPCDHADDFIELIPWVCSPFPTYWTCPIRTCLFLMIQTSWL